MSLCCDVKALRKLDELKLLVPCNLQWKRCENLARKTVDMVVMMMWGKMKTCKWYGRCWQRCKKRQIWQIYLCYLFQGGAIDMGGLIGYVKSKPFGNGQIISIDDLVIVVIIAVFHKKLIWPPVRALSKLKRHLLDLTLWTIVLKTTPAIDRWRHICFHLHFQ